MCDILEHLPAVLQDLFLDEPDEDVLGAHVAVTQLSRCRERVFQRAPVEKICGFVGSLFASRHPRGQPPTGMMQEARSFFRGVQHPEIAPKNPEVAGKSGRMSAFEEHKEELERYEQMFGRERGRLAVSLDRLTNALVLVGQHGVYCTSQRNPTLPAMDIRIIANELTSAKELVQSVMEELRRPRNDTQS